MANPAGVAIHPITGEVYVASTSAGRIHVFAAGATVPTAARDVIVPGPRALAFDPSGDLFVGTTGLNYVPVFAGGGPTQTGTVAVGFNPVGIAVHPRTRELYVGDAATDNVYVYPPGSSTPDGAKTLLGLPTPTRSRSIARAAESTSLTSALTWYASSNQGR